MNYVNNKEFIQLIKDFQQRKKENPNERIPEQVGEIFILISNNLAKRYNFSNYTYKDEMIADGILRAVEVFDKFDSEKSNNPFAYFTRVIFRKFIERIKKEKNERSMRDKLILINELYDQQEEDNFRLTHDQIIGDFVFDSKGE